MKDNTVKDSKGQSIDVYASEIELLADEYINGLDNPELITGQNKAMFTGMLKYIYINVFNIKPIDNNNIDLLNGLWSIYTGLCYKYFKRPSILGFSLLTGISNDTFNAWKNGEYRRGNGSELGSPHSLSVKKWLQECELALLDGATEQNSIGCIFGLKANYGYTEAPQQIQFIGQDNGKSIEQIVAEHSRQAQIEDSSDIEEPPSLEL